MIKNSSNHNVRMNTIFNSAVKAELVEHGSNITPITINAAEVKELSTVEEFKDYLREKSPEAVQEIEQAYGDHFDIKLQSLLTAADNDVMGAEVDFRTENFTVVTDLMENSDSKIEIITGIAGVPSDLPFYPENAPGDDTRYVQAVAVHETGHVLDTNLDTTILNKGTIPYLSPDFLPLMESEKRGDHAIHVSDPEIGQSFEHARALSGFFHRFDAHNVAGVSDDNTEITGQIKSEAYNAPMIMRYLGGMNRTAEVMATLKDDPQKFVDAVRKGMEGAELSETMRDRIDTTLDAMEIYMIPKKGSITPKQDTSNDIQEATNTTDASEFDFSAKDSEMSTNDPSMAADLALSGVDMGDTPSAIPFQKPLTSLENAGAVAP